MKTILHLRNLVLLAVFLIAASFSAKAQLTLTSPNGGESWLKGSTHNITWINEVANIEIILYKNGVSLGSIGNDASAGSPFPWTISNSLVPGNDYTVGIYDIGPWDVSDANFTIYDPISITSPISGDSWLGGSSHNITWSGGDGLTSVSINLYKNGVWQSLIGTDPDGVSPFFWSISNSLVAGADYTIQLTQGADPMIESDQFTITPQSVIVTTPNTSVIWNRGTSHTIDWTDNIPGNVDIDLYDGTSYTSITTAVAGTSYSWSIPGGQALGSTYKIRVSSSDDAGINDLSDVNFRITEPVVLSAPNGGEIWATGQTHTVSWSNGTGTVNIQLYSASGGTLYGTIASGVTSPYSWTLNGAIPAGSNYRIKITDVGDASTDFSNADFRITAPIVLGAPNGGEIWATGQTHTISWTEGAGTNTKIELWDSNTNLKVYDITTGVAGHSYSWNIGATANGSDYIIKVLDLGDASSDVSNANFRITQPVVVTAPNGSEIWATGQSHTISWSEGSGTNAKIELWNSSTNTKVYDITTGVVGQSYLWTIGATANGSDYIIKVLDLGDASSDVSNADFRITQPIVVSSPNGNEIWATGQTHTISWTEGSGTNTKIELWDSNTNLKVYDITTGVVGHSYSWNIGATANGSDYIVKLFDLGDLSADNSNADFRITQPVVVTAPNGSEIWATGQSHTISWSEGSGTNAKIELWNSSTNTKVYDITTGVIGQSYLWTIGATANGSNYIIKVLDLGDASSDVSNANFRITQPVVVTSPNGGESWYTSSTYNITWSEGSGTSTIELWKNGIYHDQLATGVSGHSWSWTISGIYLIGNDYKIKIIDTGDASTDMSNNNFTITQFTHITVPNTPGIRWNLGTSYNITWTDNVPGPVRVDLYYAGVFHSILAASVPDGTTSYSWLIPTNHQMGNHFSVRVSSVLDYTTVLDYSDFQFRIDAATNTYDIELIQPSAPSIVWTSGQDYLISWTDNLGSPVKIDLVNYTINDSTAIAASVEGSTYAWHIPGGTPNGSQYKILITSTTANGVQGLSSEYFEITDTPSQADMVVIQPSDDGIEWLRGTSHVISWTDNIPLNNVVIKLYKDTNLNDSWDAGDVFVINISASASGSTYTWSIPDVAGTYPDGMYVIKIIYNQEWDDSDYAFSISDHTTADVIDILQPDVANIHWYRDMPYLLSWNDNIPGAVDIVYYRTSAPATEYPVITNYSGGTTIVHTFSSATSPEGLDYKIKVYSNADHSVFGESANVFSLTDYTFDGTITVLQPNGGETWTKGNSYLISWDDNISENLRIDLVNDATATTTLIANDVLSSGYVWTIPNNGTVPAGILYKVKITSIETGTITDMSNAYFTIVEPALNAVVYPNPANQSVSVELNEELSGNYTLTFTDHFNMQILSRTLNTNGLKELNVSTAELSNGIYFLTITSNNSVITKKVIVQH